MNNHKANLIARRILSICASHCLASYMVLFGMMIEVWIRFGASAIIDQKLNLVFWLAPMTMAIIPILYLSTKTSGHFIIFIVICGLYIGLFIITYRWFFRRSPTVVTAFAKIFDLALLLWIPVAIIGWFSPIPVPKFIYFMLVLVTAMRLPFQIANLIKISKVRNRKKGHYSITDNDD